MEELNHTLDNTDSIRELEITKVSWWTVLLEGVVAIIVGLFLLYRPAVTVSLLIQVLGIYWLASGLIAVFGAIIYKEGNRTWKALSGILSLIAGAFILAYPLYSSFVLLNFFVIFIAIWVIVTGGIRVYSAIKRGGWAIVAVGILTIILGLLLLTNFLIGVLVLPWVFGFFLVIGGLGVLILAIKMRSRQGPKES
ncbi:MAG: HdeD family acid-resistance protein [Methanosarcina sp.]